MKKTVIAFGIGQNFIRMREALGERMRVDYVMDKKWEGTDDRFFEGIPILRLEELGRQANALVVVFPRYASMRQEIIALLKSYDVDVADAGRVFPMEYVITGKRLKEVARDGRYQDDRDNVITFESTVSDNLRVMLWGYHNILAIGRAVSADHLYVEMGNNARCSIGERTTMVESQIHASDASVLIGRDCMFSWQTMIRAHDGHHIFDQTTGKRINVGKDIVIQDQVWVCYGATLLGGAYIGTGSIVAERAVTASAFGDHVICAGNPARVIRRHICWSRDNTAYYNRSTFEECLDQAAAGYFGDSG